METRNTSTRLFGCGLDDEAEDPLPNIEDFADTATSRPSSSRPLGQSGVNDTANPVPGVSNEDADESGQQPPNLAVSLHIYTPHGILPYVLRTSKMPFPFSFIT